jgi:hypothetical protein
MYLSTMAGAVDAGELAMYAALLTDSDNSEMIEFLMAGEGRCMMRSELFDRAAPPAAAVAWEGPVMRSEGYLAKGGWV